MTGTALCVAASNDPPRRCWPSDCLSSHSRAGTPAQARISGGGRWPAATAAGGRQRRDGGRRSVSQLLVTLQTIICSISRAVALWIMQSTWA